MEFQLLWKDTQWHRNKLICEHLLNTLLRAPLIRDNGINNGFSNTVLRESTLHGSQKTAGGSVPNQLDSTSISATNFVQLRKFLFLFVQTRSPPSGPNSLCKLLRNLIWKTRAKVPILRQPPFPVAGSLSNFTSCATYLPWSLWAGKALV